MASLQIKDICSGNELYESTTEQAVSDIYRYIKDLQLDMQNEDYLAVTDSASDILALSRALLQSKQASSKGFKKLSKYA